MDTKYKMTYDIIKSRRRSNIRRPPSIDIVNLISDEDEPSASPSPLAKPPPPPSNPPGDQPSANGPRSRESSDTQADSLYGSLNSENLSHSCSTPNPSSATAMHNILQSGNSSVKLSSPISRPESIVTSVSTFHIDQLPNIYPEFWDKINSIIDQRVEQKCAELKKELEEQSHTSSMSAQSSYLDDTNQSYSSGQIIKRPTDSKGNLPRKRVQIDFHGFDVQSSLGEAKSALGMHLQTLNMIEVSSDGIPKNTNCEIYLSQPQSDIALTCVLCRKVAKRIVSHYKTAHQQHEVYVSRLSPQMVLNTKLQPFSSEKTGKHYLKAKCLFCETDRMFPLTYWKYHIRSHTGEYDNFCHGCKKVVCFRQHCGQATHCINTDVGRDEPNITGFICLHCNYVQIREENIQKHLMNEHGLGQLDCWQWYESLVLVPSVDQPNTENGLDSMSNQVQPNSLHHSRNYVSPENDEVIVNGNPLPMENSFKIDEQEAQTLFSVVDYYQKIEASDYMVRPWINGDYVTKPSMCLITQFALYKCMHASCVFSTDSSDIWKAHMNDHIKLIDVFDKHALLNNEVRDHQIKFRDCPYCPTQLGSNPECLSHIEDEHRNSIFQCAFCFYRTIEMDNMKLHYNQFHDSENDPKVLLTDFHRDFSQKDEETLAEGDQYTDEIDCNDCNYQTKYIDKFYEHLRDAHSENYKCAYCKESLLCSEPEVQMHLKMHLFAEFHCLHCKTGRNDIEAMKQHMALDHPSVYLFVATRRSDARIIYIGDGHLKWSTFKPFVVIDSELLNIMNPKVTQHEQHKIQCLDNQIAKPFSRPIPQISFKDVDDKFYIRYEDYEILKRQGKNGVAWISSDSMDGMKFIYQCITDDEANEIARIENLVYTNLECKKCSTDIKCGDENIKPYLDHLARHEICFENGGEKEMIEHCLKKHGKSPINYIRSSETVQWLIRCKFQCSIDNCCQECDTKLELTNHFALKHPDCVFDARLKQQILVIDSIDSRQPFAESYIEIDSFHFCQLFYCIHDNQCIGTRVQMIQHHATVHNASMNFEYRLNTVLLIKNQYHDKSDELASEHRNPYRMLVFECLECAKLFKSPNDVWEHYQIAGHQHDVRFTVKKLMACAECKTISTLDGIKIHYQVKHANQICKPVNATNKSLCGICQIVILTKNIQCSHPTDEHFSDVLLQRLELSGTTVESCTFTIDRYSNRKLDNIEALVKYAASIRRFKCAECLELEPLGTVDEMVNHYRDEHQMDVAKVLTKFQNIKEWLMRFSNICIHFPRGLVLPKQSINGTEFEMALTNHLITHIQNDVWPNESRHIVQTYYPEQK